MTSQHTPGPWQQFGLTILDTENAQKMVDGATWGIDSIATVKRQNDASYDQWHDAMGLANARLIAEAPAMYEALRDLARWALSAGNDISLMEHGVKDNGNYSKRGLREARERADAILARIDGAVVQS